MDDCQDARELGLPAAWTSRDEFQELQSHAEDLLHLWEVVGVSVANRVLDAQAVLTAALQAAQNCLTSLDLRREELEKQCEDLESEILEHLQSLAAGRFAKELSQAKPLPLEPKATELEQLLEQVLKALEEQDQLRKDLAEACAAMGLDPAVLADLENLSPEELQREAEKRKKQVQQELEELAIAMGVDIADLPQDGDLGAMAAKLKELQADMSALKDGTVDSAIRCKDIWESLRLGPEFPRDAAAQHLAAAKPGSAVVNAAMAAQVRRSLEAWEGKREAAQKEAQLLHAQIQGHAELADAEAFLAQHPGLHQEDLDACRVKLQSLKEACRAAEKPLRQHLRQLYHKTGCDLRDLQRCLEDVEAEATAQQRRKRLERELRRMEDYAEAISVILGQREELKALVVAGASFERAAQAGEGRWVGSSKHFLEEEKFRKRFLRQYPQLRDQLIESIEQWEESNAKTFTHKGLPLGDRLRGLREHEAVLASAKGDLSIMGILLHALGIDQDPETGRPAPSKEKGGLTPHSVSSAATSRPSPKAPRLPKLGKSSSESALKPRRSPSMKRKAMKREQSTGNLTRLPPL